MEQFLTLISTFPTVIYTVLLVLCMLYWMFVIIGAVDIDLFGAEGGVEGAKEGLAEGVKEGLFEGAKEGLFEGTKEGLFEGAKEGLFEGTKDGLVEGVKEGLAESVIEGVTEASADAAEAAESAAAKTGLVALVLNAFNMRNAPITIVSSFVVLFGWTLTVLSMLWLTPVVPDGYLYWLASAGVFGVSSLLATMVTSQVLRPLAPVFTANETIGQHTLIGGEVVVSTQYVDGDFGQAKLCTGEADLILSVRCAEPNSITKGAKALIIDYDLSSNTYFIEPMDAILPPTRESEAGVGFVVQEQEQEA